MKITTVEELVEEGLRQWQENPKRPTREVRDNLFPVISEPLCIELSRVGAAHLLEQHRPFTYVGVDIEGLRKLREACPSEAPQGVPIVRIAPNNTFVSQYNVYDCGHTYRWKECEWWSGVENKDDVCQACLLDEVTAGRVAIDMESLNQTLQFFEEQEADFLASLTEDERRREEERRAASTP